MNAHFKGTTYVIVMLRELFDHLLTSCRDAAQTAESPVNTRAVGIVQSAKSTADIPLYRGPTVYPATCSRVIRAATSALAIWSASAGLRRANKSSVRAMIPVQPVWWLAPRPAPLSP